MTIYSEEIKDNIFINFYKEKQFTLLSSEPLTHEDLKQFEIPVYLQNTDYVPSSFVINLTDECNLSCSYCSRENYIQHRNAKIIQDDLFKILFKLANYSITNNILVDIQFHGGEPTKRFLEIENSIKQLSEQQLKNLKFKIQTNATLLNDRMIDFFFLHDFDVGVSIDGNFLNKNNPRGGIEYSEKVERNTKKLISKLGGERVSCLTVLSPYNINRPLELYDYLKGIGLREFSFLPLFRTENNMTYEELSESSIDNFNDAIVNQWSIDLKMDKPIQIPNFNIWLYYLINGENTQSIPCGAGDTMLFIDYNGNLFPCGTIAHLDKYKLGNIEDESYNYAELNNIRSRINKVKDNCSRCAYQGVCRGGCYVNAVVNSDGLYKKDPFCRYWKSTINRLAITLYEDNSIIDYINFDNLRM